jgi:predicted MPP superfamily phosphohydrolase
LHSKIKASKLYETSDLILCGHTHAGLTPRWFILLTGRCFITPHRRLFPKNSYGYLKENKTIVSAGITKLSHFNPFRYFNFLYSGEIVVIDF